MSTRKDNRTITLDDGRTVTIKGSKERLTRGQSPSDEKTRVQEGFGYNDSSSDKTMVLGAEPELDSPLAWLIEKKGIRVGATHRLAGEITSIGRDGSNDISLSDESISIQHAKIRIEENKYVLYDLVSENGTEINGEKIIYKEIKENDEIKVGETVFVFKKID